MRALLTAVLFVAVCSICCSPAAAAKPQRITVKLNDVTSKDLPLKFVLQKVKWDGDSVRFWATVNNKGTRTYQSVKVCFTALDKYKKFLGRRTWHCDPTTLQKGETGCIDDMFVETEGRKPAILEIKIKVARN